jgi:hypothetical protein
VPKAFDFQVVGEETVNARPAYVLQATPRLGYQAEGRYGKMFSKIEGKLWIDKQDRGVDQSRRADDRAVLDGIAEIWGTFLLVVVAAGGKVVAARSDGAVTPGMLAVAPGLMVMAIIYSCTWLSSTRKCLTPDCFLPPICSALASHVLNIQP